MIQFIGARYWGYWNCNYRADVTTLDLETGHMHTHLLLAFHRPLLKIEVQRYCKGLGIEDAVYDDSEPSTRPEAEWKRKWKR